MAIRKPTSDVGAYGAKRWAINPAGHSPRHTNKVLELVSKLVVHSSIKVICPGAGHIIVTANR